MVAVKMDTRSVLRNSIPALVSGKLEIPTKPQFSSFPIANGDTRFPTELVHWEFISVKPSAYTSLKDLLPPSPGGLQSPTADRCSCNSGREISIKNRLVKQAAWAYLQPMEASPNSEGQNFLKSMWTRFSGEYVSNPLSSWLSFINQNICSKISRVFDRLLGALRIGEGRATKRQQ